MTTRASSSRRDPAAECLVEIFDSSGRRIHLEKERFRGGEGTIHPVVGDSGVFAKLYHSPIDALKQAKLVAMTRTAHDSLLRIAAWPSMTLHSGQGGGMVGFLMPRFDGRRAELHQLYTPATRKQTFSRADWAFLIHAARNVAAAVATVHATGHVIGDVNQRNFIIGEDTTVKVLDCDSFQIRESGHLFLCGVGMPEFTPPELQNRALGGVERTANHDAFGLAVLCFQLLFMGRHPFAGRFIGRGEMPIERAIAEGRFAFGPNNRARQMETPPNMVRFETLPPRLAGLFEAAFGGSIRRPTANEWTSALEAAKADLRTCAVEPMHKYFKALAKCSWCELETTAGVYFFIGVVSPSAAAFNLAKIWAEIAALTGLPYEPPPRPAFQVVGAPLPDDLVTRRRKLIAAKIVTIPCLLGAAFAFSDGIIAFVVFAIVIMLIRLPGAAERARRAARLQDAERAWLGAYARCERELSVEPLQAKRADLQRLKSAYEALSAQKQNELRSMTQNARSIQLQRFLEQHLIRNHSISGVGPKRKATLAMWGIVTAADVTRQSLVSVHGFGPALQTNLLAWRAVLETRFVFDAKLAVPKADLDAHEVRWQHRKLELQRQIRLGAAEVRRMNEAIRRRRVTIASDLEQPARAWAQAHADLEAADQALKGKSK